MNRDGRCDDDEEDEDEDEDGDGKRAGGSAIGTGVRLRKDGVLQVFAGDLQELEPMMDDDGRAGGR
jgi:hypothetical protein